MSKGVSLHAYKLAAKYLPDMPHTTALPTGSIIQQHPTISEPYSTIMRYGRVTQGERPRAAELWVQSQERIHRFCLPFDRSDPLGISERAWFHVLQKLQ